MKNTIYTICILAFLSFANAFGQKPVIELTFTGTNEGQTVILDSINIENLTKGGDTTLFAPINVLVLDFATGIGGNNEIETNQFSISQNYPNPFDGITSFNLNLPQKDLINIGIYDLMGREVANYRNTLDAGNHSFIFYAGKEKYYMLTAISSSASLSIKMMNFSGTETNALLVYQGNTESQSALKSQKAVSNFIFSQGDQLRLAGYAATVAGIYGSDVMEDAPQSSETYQFAITEGIPCPGIPIITYEGQTYKTVQIGTQCWFKENLNVGTMVSGSINQTNNSQIEKYCYDNDASRCITYGGLYQWNETMQYATQQGAQGICPSGWHLPTDDEWCTLTQFIDPTVSCSSSGWSGVDVATKMQSTTGWDPSCDGTNSSGFTALGSGSREPNGNFLNFWWHTYFLTSSEYNTNDSWVWNMNYGGGQISHTHFTKSCGFSIRCIRD